MTPASSVASRNLTRLVMVLAVLVALFVGIFGLQAWRAEKREQIMQMRTVLALGNNTLHQYFLQLERSLTRLTHDLLEPDGRLKDVDQVRTALQRFSTVHTDLSSIDLIRLDGQLLASSIASRAAELPHLATERSYASFLEELTPSTRLSPGQPLYTQLSRSWVTPMRHVIRDAQGRAVFVLAANVAVELLESFWRMAPIKEKAFFGLIRDDGFLISRYPLPPGVPMEVVYGEPRRGVLAQSLKAQGYPASGYVEGTNQLGGYASGNVFQRLESMPVTIFVSQPIAEFRTAWWQRVQVPFALVTLLSIGGWLGYRFTLRRQALWDAERRQAELELLESAGEQRFLIDHILAGLVRHDPAGLVVAVNAEACRLIGFSAGQMLGRSALDPLWQFIRDDGSRMPMLEYPVHRVLTIRTPLSDQTIGIVNATQAVTVWVLANTYPDFNPDGSLRSVIVTFVDITARKLAERALQQSENRYRMLFQNSMDAVLQTQPDGRILSANDAACRMFRMSEAELIAASRDQLVDLSDPRLANLRETRTHQGRAFGELTMRRGDGSTFEAEIASATYTDGSRAELASVVVRDVTEQRRSEEASRAHQLAEQASRAKSEFIARMSHELRTPLNAILGFSEVLQLDEHHRLAPVQRERLRHVQEAGGHLLLLINDLLDLSRIEAGALAITLVDADALEIVQSAVNGVGPQAAGHSVQLRIESPILALPQVRVDSTRLRQVVFNLLSNAIKYNRADGEVLISLRADSSTLKISVHDTGQGMSAEQLGALFQPFNRLGRESTAIEGTGIGLVITRNLVELMGGQLLVDSRSGLGSSFTVTLPISKPRGSTGTQDGSATVDAAAAVTAVPNAHVRGRLLYIDDDEINQILMKAFLAQRPGITLSTVGDGRSGIDLALADPPKLMLIDLMMPGMNGLQVLAAVRAERTLADVRCIAVSANAMPDEISAALAAGFDGYMTKPISMQLLLAEIDRWMSKSALPG